MKTIEVINNIASDEAGRAIDCAVQILKAIKEPDPHVVAAVADALDMHPFKVFAVWNLMVERCLE
jgi:hypothetical protein